MTRSAQKNRAVLNALNKKGLAEIPTDPKTGKWITANNRKKVRRSFFDRRICYICPKCGKPLQFRRITGFGKCLKCGQRLDWCDFDEMKSVYIRADDSGEAAYWAEAYEKISGTTYGINIEKWRLSLSDFPKILFFPFPEGKDYGRFMRLAAKDAKIVKERES